MKKNYAQRMETKNWFLEALLDLIDEKDYDKINVTDIAKKAGVPRMTYYRNYDTKDDILTEYSYYLCELLSSELKNCKDLDQRKYLLITFDFYKRHKRFALALKKLHKETLTLDIINRNIELMPVDEDSRLAMHYYAGGIYNILVDWLKSDRKDEEWIVDKIITLTDNDTIAEGLTQYTALYKKLD